MNHRLLCLAACCLLWFAPIGCGESGGSLASVALEFDAPTTNSESVESGSPETPADLTADEIKSLDSLQKVDELPLYVMTYHHDYDSVARFEPSPAAIERLESGFACSLFAAFDGPDGSLYGRNFDWYKHPALLLFTQPSDGYASVSMVDISYLGYSSENLADLQTVAGRRELLKAVQIPFDGMNDQGLVVGMAAVPNSAVPIQKGRKILTSVTLMRVMLDHAQTVDEALAFVDDYNIDFKGGPNIHYLVADRSGKSALIELKNGEIHVHRNKSPWHIATNFYLADLATSPRQACHRYAKLEDALRESNGSLSFSEAMRNLQQVSQSNTRWSVVYGIDSLHAVLALSGDFDKTFDISLAEKSIELTEQSILQK